MRTSRNWARLVGGAAAALAVAAALPAEKAKAAKAPALKLTDVNIGDYSGVPQDQVIEMTFTQPVDPASVSRATLQMRAQNSTKTGFSIEVPGSFQVAGSVVRFFPRLPTHLRDPGDPNGGFYQPGTPRDNAAANAGFQPSKNHQIIVVGAPSQSPVRGTTGRALNRTYKVNFTTSADTPKTDAFTWDSYTDAPPPGFKFSNPPDKVASVPDQYARHGGTQDVPSAIGVTLFGNKVPLSPATIRQANNVVLTLLARGDDASYRKVMQGTPYVEQNFDTVRMVFQPRFPLPDLSSYALRLTNNVKDLTEVYQFTNNRDRLNLRQIYEFLVAARTLNPTTPPAQLNDPPSEYIATGSPDTTWPVDAVERGILKTNILALGDAYPDEVDPRVMVLFTTRDEAVTHASLILSFVKSDGYFDASKSTAEWDQTVAGAASAIFTASGGSAALGDLNFSANTTLPAGSVTGGVFNYRNVNIPNGVTITFAGTTPPTQPGTPATDPVLPAPSSPVTLKCISFLLDGQISADGNTGADASTTYGYSAIVTVPITPAVPGGPGGGYGGYGPAYYSQVSNPSRSGGVGNDANLILASAANGGRGGLGGLTGSGTGYTMSSGGGGGGGSRTAGSPGTTGTVTTTSYQGSWAGVGGQGGAGATGNSDLSTLVGGAGGGGGGNGQAYTIPSYYWGTPGAGGGGGGGAILIQTSGTLTIGATGVVHSRGGRGGKGVTTGYTAGGGGGGGGGGAILMRSSRGFNLANPAVAVDVTGGAGGPANTSSYGTGGIGGNGGTGFLRFEDPNGAGTVSVPGATQGSYNPVGGGVTSYVYSKFIDEGVDNVKLLNFTANDFLMTAGNDAIFIEMQAAIENPANLGFPKTAAIDKFENSTNVNEVSQWVPVRLLDNTPGGNSFSVPGNTSTDAVFPIDTKLNGHLYRFLRLRITFQLDPTQTAQSPLPFVDQITIRYDFNF
jgi:hypothetical protein